MTFCLSKSVFGIDSGDSHILTLLGSYGKLTFLYWSIFNISHTDSILFSCDKVINPFSLPSSSLSFLITEPKNCTPVVSAASPTVIPLFNLLKCSSIFFLNSLILQLTPAINMSSTCIPNIKLPRSHTCVNMHISSFDCLKPWLIK